MGKMQGLQVKLMWPGTMKCKTSEQGTKKSVSSDGLPLPPLDSAAHVSKEVHEQLEFLSETLTEKQLENVRHTAKQMYEDSRPEGMKDVLPKGTPIDYWNEHC